ncbi:hypothetical protein Q7P37_011363 [Cladosporium fusiforme]
MFIDSKPVTGYGETAGWKIPLDAQEPTPSRAFLQKPPLLTAKSSGSSLIGMERTVPTSFKRPLFTTADSSASSLVGFEQVVMPFQEFIRLTPPIEDGKPLPPTPLRTLGGRRSSYSGRSSLSSREASPSALSRSSSIYSRTVSQWLPDSPVWSASDLADNPLSSLPPEFLRPIAYSASTPELVEKAPTPPLLLQPRTYQPLLTTPSPTISRRTTPSPPPTESRRRETKSSILLPTAVETLAIPKNHLRTVSLEKAKADLEAPGAEHLLPEELRAKSKGHTIHKARSMVPLVKEPVVRDTLAMLGRAIDSPPSLPNVPTMTLVDAEGRDRVVGTPRASVAPLPAFAFLEEPVRNPIIDAFPVGKNPPKTMLTLADQSAQKAGNNSSYYQDHGDDRGRIMQRGPRDSNFDNHYRPNGRRRGSSSSARVQEDAQQMALEYHNMLAERYRQGSASSASQSIKSDAGVGKHTRMVPQPLFHSKPLAMHMGESKGRYDSGTGSISPFQRSEYSDSGYSLQPGGPSHTNFAASHPNLSISTDRRRSSSIGTIPISPPLQYNMAPKFPMPPVPQPRAIPKHRRNSDDNRVSAYWHIPTKGGSNELIFRRSKERKPPTPKAWSPQSPGVPLLAADIISQRLQPPEATPDHSPFNENPTPVRHQQPSPNPKPPRPKEQTAKQAIFSRITKGAVKYAEQLTRPAGHEPPQSQKHTEYEPITLQTIQNLTAPVAREESPHLLPGPSPPPKRRPTHISRPSLGWSHATKQAFDSTNGHQRQQPFQASLYTHIVAPARPLDERGTGPDESEEGRGRRGSLFSTLRDFRREAKAKKRREEIKKSIKVLGVPEGNTGDGGVRGRSAEGQRIESRPEMNRWSRRSLSWMGGVGGQV